MTIPTTTRIPTAYDMATPLAFPWSVDHAPVTARHGGDIPTYQVRGRAAKPSASSITQRNNQCSPRKPH